MSSSSSTMTFNPSNMTVLDELQHPYVIGNKAVWVTSHHEYRPVLVRDIRAASAKALHTSKHEIKVELDPSYKKPEKADATQHWWVPTGHVLMQF